MYDFEGGLTLAFLLQQPHLANIPKITSINGSFGEEHPIFNLASSRFGDHQKVI